MNQDHVENTRRIARNTVWLYGRMAITMVVSLYTYRVILHALGVEDYGIYNVVGAFVAFFSLISSGLSSSIGRFLAFELGSGNTGNLRRVFSTAMAIQCSLALIIMLAGESFGIWFINSNLNIPPERLTAACWVFQFSILTFMSGLLTLPYTALITAHEKMGAFAVFGILDVVIRLAIALFIAYACPSADHLIVYGLLLMLQSFIMQTIYIVYCRRHFPECRIKLRFHKKHARDMIGFAWWNTIGCSAALFKDQGVNVLINIFFGPVANAARGLSYSVAGTACSFTNNLMAAIHPQVTKSFAANDRQYCHSLVDRGSRFAFYIIMVLAIPIMLDTPYLLRLWLGSYPSDTVLFTRLVLILTMIDVLSATLITLQAATGRIRDYQLVVGGVLLLNFPVTYILFKIGCPAYSTFVAAIVISLSCLILRLLFLRKMAGLGMRRYLRSVILRVFLVTALASTLPLAVHINMDESFLRLAAESAASLLSSAAAVLSVGCDTSERRFIMDILSKFRHRAMALVGIR